MITYTCDGVKFFGKTKCERNERYNPPTDWLKIDGHVRNELAYRRGIESNYTLHFCSKECFINYFFIDMPSYNELSLWQTIFNAGIAASGKQDITEKEKCDSFLEFIKELNNFEEMSKNEDFRSIVRAFYYSEPED